MLLSTPGRVVVEWLASMRCDAMVLSFSLKDVQRHCHCMILKLSWTVSTWHSRSEQQKRRKLAIQLGAHGQGEAGQLSRATASAQALEQSTRRARQQLLWLQFRREMILIECVALSNERCPSSSEQCAWLGTVASSGQTSRRRWGPVAPHCPLKLSKLGSRLSLWVRGQMQEVSQTRRSAAGALPCWPKSGLESCRQGAVCSLFTRALSARRERESWH